MRIISTLQKMNLTRVGLVLSAILLTLIAGVSGLIFKSTQSPLFILGTMLAVLFVVVCLYDPAWATCTAVFIAMLPRQILSSITVPILRDYTVLLCLVFACFIWFIGVIAHRLNIAWKSTNLLMFAFLVWSIVTLFWTSNLILGRKSLVAYTIGLMLLILIANNINSFKTINRLMFMLALNGLILMLAGVVTIVTKGYVSGTRLEVLEMNENEMGVLAMLTLIGVLWQIMQLSPRHRLLMEILSWIFLAMTIVLVVASGSRGSAISLIITLLCFCFWKPTRGWGLRGLVILGLGAIFVPMLFTTTLERFAIIGGDTFLGGREVLWQATWNLIGDHLWFGVGIGNARSELIDYLFQLTGVAGVEKAPTHNPVLQVWAETGLPGILLYLGALGSAVWLFIRYFFHYRKSGKKALFPYFALVFSLFIGYMVSWIKGGGMETSFSYYVVLSLLIIPASQNLKDHEEVNGCVHSAVSNSPVSCKLRSEVRE